MNRRELLTGTAALAATSAEARIGPGRVAFLGTGQRSAIQNNSVVVTGTSLAWGQGSTGQGTDAGGIAGLINGTAGYIGHEIGYPGQNSTYCIDHWLVDGAAYRTWTTVFWIAANNVGQTSVVLADLARGVAALQAVGNNRYLIFLEYPPEISVSNGTFAQYATLDNAPAAAYPNNYYDTRVNFATDAPGVPPAAYLSDAPDPGLHPNDTGYGVLFTSSGTGGIGLIAKLAQLPAAPPDTVPDAYSFTSVIGQLTSTVVASNTVRISGMNAAAPISISAGGEYQITDFSGSVVVPWTSSAGTIDNGAYVTVRQTTSGSLGTTTTVNLTIGGVAAAFSTKTVTSANLISNGDFSGGSTGWVVTNVTISSGAAHFSASNFGNVRQAISATAAKTYRATYTILNYAAGSGRARIFGTTNSDGTLFNANGTYTVDIVAPVNPTSFRIIGATSSDTFDVDNISLYQID